MNATSTFPTAQARALYPFYTLSTAAPEFLASATMPEIARWFTSGAGFDLGSGFDTARFGLLDWQKVMAILALIDHGNPNAALLTALAFDCYSPEEAFDQIASGAFNSRAFNSCEEAV